MSTWHPDLPPGPPPSQPHGLETERRLTRLEMTSEDHEESIEAHSKRHDDQDTWNKGFMVALAGLGAGLAHAKATDFLDVIITLLKRFKP